MATQHSISELLTSGAKPTQEEVRYLSEMGRFTASLLARYLSGAGRERRDAGSRHQAMVAALEGRMAHGGAAQWMAGMGVGAAQLADRWHGLWKLSAGLSEGYQRLEPAEMEVFELLPDAVTAPYLAFQSEASARRPSLFGPRSRVAKQRERSGAPAAKLAPSTLLRLREGGHVSVAVLEALARGGLPLADQVDLGVSAANPAESRAAASTKRTAASTRPARAAQAVGPGPGPGQFARARQHVGAGSKRILLDGLEIDARTPALAGALELAEHAFGFARDRTTGLSVSRVGTERMLQGPSRAVLSADSAPARPVFGFFDSVEGEFLSLERAADAEGTSPAAGRQREIGRGERAPSASPRTPAARSQATTRSPQAPIYEGGIAPASAAASAPRPSPARDVTATRLSTVVPGAPVGSPLVRPVVGGVFSNPQPAGPGSQAAIATRPGLATAGDGRLRPEVASAASPSGMAATAALHAERAVRPTRNRRPIAGMIGTFGTGDPGRGPAAFLADEVVYDGAGHARPRVNRSAFGAPRVNLRSAMQHQATSGGGGQQGTLETVQVVGPLGRGLTQGEGRGPARSADAGEALAAPGSKATSPLISEVWSDSPAASLGAGGAWRLAQDLGRDLPLGSTLTSHERLAGDFVTNASRGVGGGTAFRPLVSGAPAEPAGGPRGARSHAFDHMDALDGVAWVAVEQESSELTRPDVALAVVPSGRRAVMTSASAAHALRWIRRSDAPASTSRPPAALPLIAPEMGSLGERRSSGELRPPATRGAAVAPRPPERSIAGARRGGTEFTEEPTAVPAHRMGLGAEAGASARARQAAVLPAGTALVDLRTARPAGLVGDRVAGSRMVEGLPAVAIGDASRPGQGRRPAGGVAQDGRFAGPTEQRSAIGARPAGPSHEADASAWRSQSRAARRALLRPGLTGREWLETQAFLGESGPIGGAARSTAWRRSQSEPSLLLSLESRSALASLLGASVELDGPALMGRIANLAPADAVKVGRALRAAGWAEPELAMLQLPAEIGSGVSSIHERAVPVGERGLTRTPGSRPALAPASAARATEAARRGAKAPVQTEGVRTPAGTLGSLDHAARSGDRAAAPAVLSAGVASTTGPAAASGDWSVEKGHVNRLARNLARIITGTPALTGARATRANRGAAPLLNVEALLAGASGLLGPAGASQDYFAGLAPMRAARGVRVGTLRDAIGELLSVAQAEVASGRSAEPVARASLTQQLRWIESAIRSSVRGAEAARGAEATADSASGLGGRAMGGDAPLVTRSIGRAVVQPLLGDRSATVDRAYGSYPDADRHLVTPHAETGVESIAQRLASAISQSARGPAGVERLLATSAGRRRPQSNLGAPAVGGDSGRVSSARALGAGEVSEGQRTARRAERRTLGESVELGSVLAPEAMLGGLWSAVADDAPAAPWRGGVADDRALVAQASAPEGIARAGESAGPGVVAASRGASRSPVGSVRGDGGERPSVGRRQTASGEGGRRELLLGRITRILERAGVRSEAAQEVLVDAFARNVGRGRRLVAREHGAMAEFSWAWLGRVDGSRSGIDLELQGDRDAFARTFAGARAQRSEQPSGAASPRAYTAMDEAGFVVPGSAPATQSVQAVEDRSGVRRVARAAGLGRGGSARSVHRAAEAARQTNWRFVDTGSRASSAHADLGRLAATVLDSPDVGRRVPMPFVMPAVKAVAQSALREDASAPGANVEGARQRADQQAQQGQDGADAKAGAKLSDEALDALAHEFADRIARRMKREQERRGLCR